MVLVMMIWMVLYDMKIDMEVDVPSIAASDQAWYYCQRTLLYQVWLLVRQTSPH